MRFALQFPIIAVSLFSGCLALASDDNNATQTTPAVKKTVVSNIPTTAASTVAPVAAEDVVLDIHVSFYACAAAPKSAQLFGNAQVAIDHIEKPISSGGWGARAGFRDIEKGWWGAFVTDLGSEAEAEVYRPLLKSGKIVAVFADAQDMKWASRPEVLTGSTDVLAHVTFVRSRYEKSYPNRFTLIKVAKPTPSPALTPGAGASSIPVSTAVHATGPRSSSTLTANK